ncbi:MAG: phosphatidylserine/phosphatidylglycerophosphate/cardiolipin synthase family protein [Novosphingobium sp.]|nr:phosphatidylserine/phosphatidylglycerophosphate/cardiolipin synthase family protein [Novosphingobium sp.]
MNDIQGAPDGPVRYQDPPPFSADAQGHALTFYPGGSDRFAALLGLIEGSIRSLRLCFYIYADDDCGRRVTEALCAAARRGVKVSLMIDSFGSNGTPDSAFDAVREAGCAFCFFGSHWSARYLVRNHQKLVIADQERAMIGGFNVARDYFEPPENDGWNDLAVVLTGPVVERLVEWYDRLHALTSAPHQSWRGIRRLVREWDPGTGPVQLLLGGPTRRLSLWARKVNDDLAAANRLDLVMAYFSPAARLLARIGRVARRGQARLLLPARSDNGATIGASRLLYGVLLKRRAKIYEFTPCKLHAKLIVIDDVVYVGSANFDMRSLYINLEIMLRIEDAALAERMRAYVSQQIAASLPITRALHHRRRTLLNRIRWALSWFLVSVVDYTVTRRLNFGQ